MNIRNILLLTAAVAFGAMFYLFLSTPDYGDLNADPMVKGEQALQQGDFDTAAEWFGVAAKQGKPEAQYRFAMLYRDGQGVDQDDTQAVRWLKLAAAQGHTEAQYELGMLLENGRGVEQREATAAVQWFSKAAASNHAGAELRL